MKKYNEKANKYITNPMQRIKIERDVPMELASVRSFFGKVLTQMESGDSVVVSDGKERNQIQALAANHGIPITTRSIGNKRVRVWRR
jgi:hypothetical protein